MSIKGKTTPNWILVDAKDQSLGRLVHPDCKLYSGQAQSRHLHPGRGYGPMRLWVINASLLRFTQKRLEDKKYISGTPDTLVG